MNHLSSASASSNPQTNSINKRSASTTPSYSTGFSSTFQDLQKTSGNMQYQIADATKNFFGGRHAPAARQQMIQNPRDSASRLLHGDHTNVAGHHDLFDPSLQKFKNQEIDERRKTRAIHWKQEREVRQDVLNERREVAYAKQEAIEKTKHERSCSRVQDPFRDVDYFLRREKGPRVVKECPVRSENTKIGNWLFDYPVKKNQ